MNLTFYFCAVTNTQKIMIDIQQLTSLISAFRVETEKESISPETVGSILQAIACWPPLPARPNVAPQKVDTGRQENDLMLYLCVADSLLSSVLRA